MNDLKGIIEDCNKSDLVSDKVIKKIIEIIGQEKWQDLYDEESDICTTMGELIITLKDIPYLEEELEEYKNGNFVQTVNQIIEGKDKRLEQSRKLLEWFVWYFREGSPNLVPYKHKVKEVDQFLNGENVILEDAQAGNSPFDADEVFNKEMKAYTDEALGISDIHKYSHKLFDAFEKLDFKTTFNKAIQAFYLEEGLYVVRSESMGKYQYTLVEASSEEMAIRKCM